jgi:phosphatidylserine/phosphatidylglycerophosphate/cardiolipin synthase-like enzyme
VKTRPRVIVSIIALSSTLLLPAAPGAAERVDGALRRGPVETDLTVLPEDGRDIYFSAIDAARREIRIEICVLEDPQILARLQAALQQGVRVRVIVDRG